MFERFTDRARRVVVLAQEEARRFGHNYVGTEHLLLGLVKEGEGLAAKVLVGMGVELDRVREAVEQRVGDGGGTSTGQLPFTGPAKTALELSLREALELGHNYIGTEHILLGLVREGEGMASEVLAGFNVGAAAVRTAVQAMLTGGTQGKPAGHGVQAPQAGPAGAGPNCPSCRSPLEGRLGWKDLSAEGDPIKAVRVFYCGACGSAVTVSAQ